MRRRATPSGILALRLAALPLAAVAALPTSAVAQGTAGPAQAIEALQAALTQVEHSMAGFTARAAILAPVIDRSFDLETILKNSIGLSWATIPPAQQQSLLATFRQYTIASYVSNFSDGDAVFSVAPATRQAGADTVVQTAITPESGSPTRVDYVMRPEPQGSRVVDVLVDGTISRVAVQRSDFRSAMEDGGAQGLETVLKRKVSTLSDGQMQP